MNYFLKTVFIACTLFLATGCGNLLYTGNFKPASGAANLSLPAESNEFNCGVNYTVVPTGSGTGTTAYSYSVCRSTIPGNSNEFQITPNQKFNSSYWICMFPATSTGSSGSAIPDYSGLPVSACAQVESGAATISFSSTSLGSNVNAAFIIIGTNYTSLQYQMQNCLYDGESNTCPAYSYGKF